MGQFDGSLSWIDEEGLLLSHEQIHFNIQELLVRKTNKRLDSIYQSTGEKVDYKFLRHKLNREIDKVNDKFDFETNHGINYQKNWEWETRIVKEIESLNEFRIDCLD